MQGVMLKLVPTTIPLLLDPAHSPTCPPDNSYSEGLRSTMLPACLSSGMRDDTLETPPSPTPAERLTKVSQEAIIQGRGHGSVAGVLSVGAAPHLRSTRAGERGDIADGGLITCEAQVKRGRFFLFEDLASLHPGTVRADPFRPAGAAARLYLWPLSPIGLPTLNRAR